MFECPVITVSCAPESLALVVRIVCGLAFACPNVLFTVVVSAAFLA